MILKSLSLFKKLFIKTMFFTFYMGEDYSFVKDIDFDDIRDIKKVFQPGILSLSYLFNPSSLKDSLSELCGYSSKDIIVYFKNIEDINITSDAVEMAHLALMKKIK
jgi:hypothetical protein